MKDDDGVTSGEKAVKEKSLGITKINNYCDATVSKEGRCREMRNRCLDME